MTHFTLLKLLTVLLPQSGFVQQAITLKFRPLSIRFQSARSDDEFTWACGPPIDMKIGLIVCGMLKGRGRHRSDYTLDKVRPFLSLIGNARFEPIYVAPSLRVGRVVARDGV